MSLTLNPQVHGKRSSSPRLSHFRRWVFIWNAYHGQRIYAGVEEIIELTAVAAAFEFFPRFNSALHIPVTLLPEAK